MLLLQLLLQHRVYVVNTAVIMATLKPNLNTWFSAHDWREVRPQECR